MGMFSATEVFSVSGPSHIISVDWTNAHHRRAIAASLVEAVYKIQRDRQKNRQGRREQAPPYWKFFHFKLNHVLIDNEDNSIFGAIYEYNFPNPHLFNHNHNQLNPPKYVIAFRGTLTQPSTIWRDLKLDFQCICNKIHKSSRVLLAMEAIQRVVSECGAKNVWLAGHSLGSAIALLVGKNMAKMRRPLETYLFNPPFISAPIESIKEERVRRRIRIAGSVMKAGLSAVVNDHHYNHELSSQENNDRDTFNVLSAWFPYLFVNPADHICSGYIGYFENRQEMEEIGFGKIGKLATKCSVQSIFSRALGKETEAYDLLPSAYVIINQTPSPNFRRAHSIKQWWNPNFDYRSLTYQFSR